MQPPNRTGAADPRLLSAACALGALLVSAAALAQNCNLVSPPGSIDCAGGCTGSFAVQHGEQAPCGATTGAGSFDLTGTVYADSCREGACPGGVGLPPLRFWWYDNYGRANSGLADPVASRWLVHAHFDYPQAGSPRGLWSLDFGNWSNPTRPGPSRVDGCIGFATGPQPTRTVADLRDLEADGTPEHDSWYVVAAARWATAFDFDHLSGGDIGRFGTACAPSSLPRRPVPQPIVAGLDAASCLDPGVAGQTRPGAAGYFDLTVALQPTPAYFTEVGLFDPEAPLIDGYQLVFARVEPWSSRWNPDLWTPVFDPADPGQPRGTIRFGTRQVDVSLPDEPGVGFWLAARLVYADCSINSSLIARPDCATAPPLASAEAIVATHLSRHCGPVRTP